MRESLLRQRGPKRFSNPKPQCNTGRAWWMRLRPHGRLQVSRIAAVLLAALLLPTVAFAQSPWERAAGNLEQTFTGPLARSLALVAIVLGGLMFMFGEAGAKRQISGIVFGGGLALFAAQFLTWLF
jgi:type IV secretory pathway VirB2 component (pilin)